MIQYPFSSLLDVVCNTNILLANVLYEKTGFAYQIIRT